MTPYERLFSPTHAFDHPVTCWVVGLLVAALALTIAVGAFLVLMLGRWVGVLLIGQ